MSDSAPNHPPQEQPYPGRTTEMSPRPEDEMRDYEGSGLLEGRTALVTGGDSGIGRAVAIGFAKEGADAAIAYLSELEDEDAAHTCQLIEAQGRRSLRMRTDLSEEKHCYKQLIDYSATKGAINAFTFALAQSLVDRRIRVNAVAPGPVWTPLIPSTFPPDKTEGFGGQAPMNRPAQPDEIAPSYIFFASDRLSSYYSGEVLAPVGGETVPA